MIFNELRDDLKKSLDCKDNESVRKLLYRRGYLITNRDNLNLTAYPFYNNWTRYKIADDKYAYVHNDQKFYIEKNNEATIVLIGNAYNPFDSKYSEQELLCDCLESYQNSMKCFWDKISEFAGIHIIGLFTGDGDYYVQDCTAMKACYYGKKDSNYFITSHCALVNDVADMSVNKFTQSLLDTYAFRHWGSEYLPGDVTVFNELSRLGPNLFLSFKNDEFDIDRFYPIASHPTKNENDIDTINYIADILKESVRLCSVKWSRPAISLSGGMDSRTTFAASNGCYDEFKYYSFYCKSQELDDANAAKYICESVGVKHDMYPISENNEDFEKFDIIKKIIAHSASYVNIPGDHEIRKYIFLSTLDDFDVELKSWASEIGRAYWERRYGFRLPEKLTPRDFSIFQTRFLGTIGLMRQNDKYNKQFLQKSKFIHPVFNYEDTDLFYWEYRFGSNGTNVTMGQDIFNFEVTMPMNSRKLMDMFLWYPHDFRKNDMIHKATILRNEPKFKNIDADVHNGYFSKKRVLLEKYYYKYRMLFYRDK